MDVHRIAVNRHKCFPTLLLKQQKYALSAFGLMVYRVTQFLHDIVQAGITRANKR